MNAEMKKLKFRKVIVIALAVVLLIGAGSVIYTHDYYHTDPKALEAMQSSETVTIKHIDRRTTIFEPEQAKAGIIFYPGGKVEYSAYAPLLHQLAEQGILAILVKMPGNLAVLDGNAADGLKELYPEIKDWYLGGHSLGGVMAASYVEKHTKEYQGLILLASYSTADISDTNLKVITMYGSCDGVLNLSKYRENRSNLPAHHIEKVIDGGCHAYFGMYGEQKGDGVPKITNEEQIKITVSTICEQLL